MLVCRYACYIGCYHTAVVELLAYERELSAIYPQRYNSILCVIVLYRDQQSVASPNKVKQKDSNSKVTAILVLAKVCSSKLCHFLFMPQELSSSLLDHVYISTHHTCARLTLHIPSEQNVPKRVTLRFKIFLDTYSFRAQANW